MSSGGTIGSSPERVTCSIKSRLRWLIVRHNVWLWLPTTCCPRTRQRPTGSICWNYASCWEARTPRHKQCSACFKTRNWGTWRGSFWRPKNTEYEHFTFLLLLHIRNLFLDLCKFTKGQPSSSPSFTFTSFFTFFYFLQLMLHFLDRYPDPCVVCSEAWKLDDEARKLPCKHTFHNDCIIPWLEVVRHILLHFLHLFSFIPS